MKRIIYSIILILSAFLLNWWIVSILAIVGLFYFDNYFEAVIAGLIIDSLYGAVLTFYGFEFVFTVFFLIVSFLISRFRSQLLIRS